MANGKSDRKKLAKKLTTTIIALVIFLGASFFGIDVLETEPDSEIVLATKPTTEATISTIEEVTTVPIQNLEGELVVHMIDQTTPNMIQGLKGIFERNALISRGYSLF